MEYRIVTKGKKNLLNITDNKTGEFFIVPKKFSYLKLIENDEGEYQFAFCTKKGNIISDYKKYAEIDSKFTHIDTEVIDDEELDFEELYEEKHIFSIRADKTNPQIVSIFDINDDTEIGVLSNSMPIEEQNYERKIIAYNNKDYGPYVTMLDILKMYAPDAFGKNGNFKYLNKVNDIDLKVSMEFKNSSDSNTAIAGWTNGPACLSTHGKNGSCYSHDYYFTLDSKQKHECNLQKLFTDDDSMRIYLKTSNVDKSKPLIYIRENGFPLQIVENGSKIFEHHLDSEISIYGPDYML